MAIITTAITIPASVYDSTNSSYYSTYNNTSDSAVDGVYNGNYPSNGATSVDSTTRACVFSNTGANAESYLYYGFDVSTIPANATIISVTCSGKASYYSSNSLISTHELQLCNGTTAKGTAVSVTGTSSNGSTHTLTGTSWTRNELNNIRIRYRVVRSSTNPSNAASFSFFGASLYVQYSYDDGGTPTEEYQITSVSNTTAATITPSGVQTVNGGDSCLFLVDYNTGASIYVEDNGVDVTDQLVKMTVTSSTAVLGTYTLVSGSFNGQGASYFSGLVGKGVNGSQTTTNYYSQGSGTIAVFTYDFSFSNVPNGAIITNLYCEVNGHAESTSNNNEYMCVQLVSGDTALSDELNFKSYGTGNTTVTLSASTVPSSLSGLKLKCRLGYYGGAINGATCYVEYYYLNPSASSNFKYGYQLANISTSHTITVNEVFIPEPEDPTKTYYSLTISSINAETTPGTGTERVESGTGQTITITPSDPLLTLALDNGADVTSQLVYHAGATPTSALTTVQGASYTFNWCGDTGYYMSTNKGKSNSAAVCRVTFNLPVRCLITIEYINYAEATYDYGIFGNIDTALGTTYSVDSNVKLSCNTNAYNTSSPQTLTYEMEAGEHFVDIKYRKDTNTDSNNDTLQFKVSSIQTLEANNYYTYDLIGINQDHSLIFIFGNVSYYFVTSQVTGNGKLYPTGQMVQLPGDEYKLVIVPDDTAATVTMTDNGNDVTSSLGYKEIEAVKEGVTTTIVNYTYSLSNIQTGHTLNVTIGAQQGTGVYIKQSGSWVELKKVYRKENNAWVEQDDYEELFENGNLYVNGGHIESH